MCHCGEKSAESNDREQHRLRNVQQVTGGKS
jgi:hypothetical protein